MGKVSVLLAVAVMAGSSLSEPAQAGWERVVHCDDGTTVDVNTGERRNLQLVIRGDNALRDLSQRGMVHLNWGDREAVLGTYAERGVFNPGDFKFIQISLRNGMRADVAREGETIHVYFNQVVSWTEYPVDCRGNELSMSCEGQGVYRSRTDYYGDYVFRGCR